jgi:hypothetical protein
MANWWDKLLTDKQKFRLQQPQDPSLLDVVANVPNPAGDVASGLLAAQDVSKGNYGTAALNSLGLLPFVPSMGAIVKNAEKAELKEVPLNISEIPLNELDMNPYGKSIAKSFYMWNPKLAKKSFNNEPVSVVRLPDGRIHLLDGYHRVTQATMNNKPSIMANEYPMTDLIMQSLKKDEIIK